MNSYIDMRCYNCTSTILQRMGDHLYCVQCEAINSQIQLEIKYTPGFVTSNATVRKQADFNRRLQNLLRQFYSRYENISKSENQAFLLRIFYKMKKIEPKLKGSRQLAAVIFYQAFKQSIKLSISKFCKQNKLKQKIFNQKYIFYHQIYSKKQVTSILQAQSQRYYQNTIKMQQKNSIILRRQSIDYQNESIEQPQQSKTLSQQYRKCVESIFDELFSNYCLKQRKQLITYNIITKITNIPQDQYNVLKNKAEKRIIMYYIIFSIIKNLKFKITFQRYRDIVHKKTGYLLIKHQSNEIKKFYDGISKKNEDEYSQQLIQVKGIKVQDNNPLPRIRFPVADSDNQFSYEYFIEDQFYY